MALALMDFIAPRPNATTRQLFAIVLWPVAIFSFIHRTVLLSAKSPGGDFKLVYDASVGILHHQAGLTTPGFGYLPSAPFLCIPFTLLPFEQAKIVFLVLSSITIGVAGLLALRMFNQDWRGLPGAGVILALSLMYPVAGTLWNRNVNALLMLVEVGILFAASRNRWTVAGLILGVSIAIKPVLAVLIIMFLLRRKWGGIAWAVAVPGLLSLPALAMDANPLGFFTSTVPWVANAFPCCDPDIPYYNVALASVGENLHVPAMIVSAIRAIVFLAGSALIWLRWREPSKDDTLKLVEVASMLLMVTFLCFSFSWRYYAIYLVVLGVSVVAQGSMMRNLFAWGAMYFLLTIDIWTSTRLTDFENTFLDATATWCYLALLAIFGVQLLRRAVFQPSRQLDHEPRPQLAAAV
jgi:arabinofuranan 3-O-arabinosyltransferase